jgi:hypothetical protein
MARFHGNIGYSTDIVETAPGVFTDVITEREYYGDVIKQTKQWISGSQVNDNLNINNRISIIADDYAFTNFSAAKYVIWAGVYWKISNIDIERPRLILSLGGVYNGTKG